MNAVFAETFFWIAIADSTDSSHSRALEITSRLADVRVVTTDEVVSEYLTFFATADEWMRRKTITNARHFEQEGFRALFRDA